MQRLTRFLLLWILCSSTSVLAWGPEGHALIADMAERHLTPEARIEVARLLAVEGYRHLDQIASWPDAMRADNPDTGPWHYVDIPLYALNYNQQRDCHVDQHNERVPELTCVVVQLPRFVRILADTARPDAEREVALKWVVHLVGDIHQPLHTEDDHDRGGNNVRMDWYGHPANLHWIWDLGLIERHYHWQLGPAYSFDHAAVLAQADELDTNAHETQRQATYLPNGISSIDKLTVSWANDAHELACHAYRHLPAEYTSGWEEAYQSWGWPVAKNQLQLAGVRLAAVLNTALHTAAPRSTQ